MEKLVDVATGGRNPLFAIAQWFAHHFFYVPDPIQYGVEDVWPTREQLAENIEQHNGVLHGDCDDHAFAAVMLLKDCANIKGRVILCWTEPVAQEGSSEKAPAYHAVCEAEDGSVIDNRYPGRVMNWTQLEEAGYKRDRMSGFFEFGDTDHWTMCETASDSHEAPQGE